METTLYCHVNISTLYVGIYSIWAYIFLDPKYIVSPAIHVDDN